MHDPLRPIHDLVFHHLQPSQLLLLNSSALALLWQQAQCRVSELVGVFVQCLCTLPARKEKKAMVESFHATAVLLCNQLHEYANTVENLPLQEQGKQELSTAYRALRDQLYNSLNVLERFPALVNKEQFLPLHAMEAARYWALDAMQQINKKWTRKIEPELLRILNEPLQDLVNGEPEPNLSIHTLHYLTKLVQHTGRLAMTVTKDAGTALVFLLIRLNHNSDAFLHYACRHLQPHELDEGTPAYLLHCRRSLLQVQQLQPMPGLALYPSLPCCQSGISRYLREEIGLLENYTQQSLTHMSDSTVAPSARGPLFKSCLTMSQLAVMLRWCSQTGILHTETIEDLFKAVARSVKTAGKGSFKASSLQTKYYELDPAAISGAKDVVIRLLNEARKHPL